MKCTNCGNEVPNTAKVCGHCGQRLKLGAPPLVARSTAVKQALPGWAWGLIGGLVVVTGIAVFIAIRSAQANSPAIPPTAIVLPTDIPTRIPSPTKVPPTNTPLPTATSEPHTATSIIVEPLQNQDNAPRLIDIAEYTGDFTWTVRISSNTPAILHAGWCATTKEILEQNLQHMLIQVYANSENVTNAMVQVEKPTSDGYFCHNYYGIIRTWPVGRHIIEYITIFLEKVNNGDSDWGGEEISTYTIYVTP